jgi:hypothetical protein
MRALEESINYTKESRHYYPPNDIVNIIKPEVTLKKKGIVINNNKIHFLLCGSCFWCASNFNNIDDTIIITTTKCPCCDSTRVESIPISYNEVYKFDYDPKRGVTLEFSKVDDEEEVTLN